MILGIGNDLVDIRRIEKVLSSNPERFEERCFTKAEQAKAHKYKNPDKRLSFYAKRFAAKEACAKALGTGFTQNVAMKNIGVIEGENGRPLLELKEGALDCLNLITPKGMASRLHLSLSDDFPYAQAFVVIEAIRS